ncbi:ABC-three component system middle component 2 [Rhizobium leguminosarum]|uniref:ABC-three component system middle component 2 n=1 Tax=Rhizobium/Agrobacterium group TaxID=227290 RepID=UPI00103AE733|nr:ABC-three component system middle component 2 [Rhizobium leguminosarum]TCA41405.1 threonine transporter [Rhizobium leguminosarum bv. viciae]
MATLVPPASAFNGPLETGVRAVFVLHAHFPRVVDLNRLTAMDYLVVRTSVLEGPADLHPPTPIMSPVTQVRRKSVQSAVALMMSRGLIEQLVDESGILFQAGDNAEFFVTALQTPYLQQLYERAQWLAGYFENYSDEGFDDLMRNLLANWVSEFQDEASGPAS